MRKRRGRLRASSPTRRARAARGASTRSAAAREGCQRHTEAPLLAREQTSYLARVPREHSGKDCNAAKIICVDTIDSAVYNTAGEGIFTCTTQHTVYTALLAVHNMNVREY